MSSLFNTAKTVGGISVRTPFCTHHFSRDNVVTTAGCGVVWGVVVVRGEEGGGGGVCCVFSHFRLCHFDFVAVTHRLDTCQTSTTTGLGPLGAFSVCGPRTGLLHLLACVVVLSSHFLGGTSVRYVSPSLHCSSLR